MRFLLVLGIIICVLAAGCASPESGQAQQEPQGVQKNQTCRLVSEDVPVTQEECGDISYTEEECSLRKLNYSTASVPKVDLCISDGVCTGKPLGDCPGCVKAMTRCVLKVTNLEPQKSGTWVVAANYTLGSAGFNKEPISITIGPNQTADFDFNQIYTPGFPINSASCNIAVMSEPSIEACVSVTKTRLQCRNVTRTETRQSQVCE